MLRQQEAIADGKPNLSLADFVGRARAGVHRLPRRVRGDGGTRRRRAGARASRRARRLQRDHGEGAGRSAGRGVRGVPARARAHGMGHRRGARRRTTCLAESTAASARASAIRRVPITARSSSCSTCSTRGRSGSTLTEHAAMTPAASVSGLYFAHPQARYFTVGRLGDDQIAELRAPEGPVDRGGRALADAEPRLRTRALLIHPVPRGRIATHHVPRSSPRRQPLIYRVAGRSRPMRQFSY